MATDLSTLVGTEQIKQIDKKTAKRYRVVEETIDLEALKREKEMLEAELNMPEPSKEELIELGRSMHEYYLRDVEAIKKRIEEINNILGK